MWQSRTFGRRALLCGSVRIDHGHGEGPARGSQVVERRPLPAIATTSTFTRQIPDHHQLLLRSERGQRLDDPAVNDRFKIPNKDNSISSKTTIEFPQKRQRKFPKNDRVNSSQTTI